MYFSAPLPYRADASIYFSMLRTLPWAAWLDSGSRGRYDVLVAAPIETLVYEEGMTRIVGPSGPLTSNQSPFELLRAHLGAISAPCSDVPFAGGALGYWGYDLARRDISLPHTAKDAEHLPQMVVGIYDWAVIIDHQAQEAKLVSYQRYPQTEQELTRVLALLSDLSEGPIVDQAAFRVSGEIMPSFTPENYRQAFQQVKAYLQEGDCYQVNLAQRFSAPATGDAWAAYLALRASSPAPYSAFLDFPQVQVLCASPERFLVVRDGKVETKPIKGTRPRMQNSEEDARMVRELATHPKDRAENLMIVDLLRNDLGKCCAAGTVRTPKLFEVESYAQVHHLVSTVEGRLRKDCDALDLLQACFPGGSITGAPKQRAMEVIEELEPYRRGIYCGSIGYIGFDGQMDCNITIRTMVYAHGELRCWAGGGIVADSRCEAEYQETLDKARAMLEVMRRFQR